MDMMGGGGGGGGGGFAPPPPMEPIAPAPPPLLPDEMPTEAEVEVAPEEKGLPKWVWYAGGAALAYFLFFRKRGQ